MPINEQTVEQIANDVKKFGETAEGLKAMNDNAKRELGEMRAELDKHGKKLDAISAEKIDKLAASIEAQDAALAGLKGLPEQVDKIDAVLKRPGGEGGWSGEEATAEAKAAFEFAKAKLISEGKLGANTDVTADVEAYAAYAKAFAPYMRARTEASMPRDYQAAMQTGSDPDGGYLVPKTVSSRIITKVYESSNLRALATVESIGGKELELPRDEGEFGYGGWVGETTAPSETSTAQVGVSKIFAHEMFAEPRVTQSMLEDAGIDIEAWVAKKVGEKMGRIEATAFHTGSGTNQPRGFLTYAAGTNNGQIEQIISGDATLLKADAFFDVAFSLKDFYTANAKWLMKRTSVRDVAKLKDGEGNYLWQMGDFKSGVPSTILGYEVVRDEDMPTVAAGALAVAFGDFGAGYTIVDRLGITLLRDNLTAKPWVKFYTRRRVGGDVVNFEAIKLMKVAAS